MKTLFHNIKLILLLSMVAFIVHGYKLPATCNLTVKITDLRNNKGVVEIGLYSERNQFPEPGQQYKKVREPIKSNEVAYVFKNIPQGNYAISTYHDENQDKKCNRNTFGIPTEAYAFSRNYRPMLKKPSFNDCSFKVYGAKTIQIKMVY